MLTVVELSLEIGVLDTLLFIDTKIWWVKHHGTIPSGSSNSRKYVSFINRSFLSCINEIL